MVVAKVASIRADETASSWIRSLVETVEERVWIFVEVFSNGSDSVKIKERVLVVDERAL